MAELSERSCTSGHPMLDGDEFCGICGTPMADEPSADTARAFADVVVEPNRRRAWHRLAAAIAVVVIVAGIGFIASARHRGSGDTTDAVAPRAVTHPSNGYAQCADPSQDVVYRRDGQEVRNGSVTQGAAEVDITNVGVTIDQNQMMLDLRTVGTPFRYPHGFFYLYRIDLYRPRSADYARRLLYSMVLTSEGVATPGKPVQRQVLSALSTTGKRTTITDATFDISTNTISMTVPISSVPNLPSRFEFSAGSEFDGQSTTGTGMWTDACPTAADADGSMRGITLPRFPQSDAAAPPSTSPPTTTTQQTTSTALSPTTTATATGYPTLAPATTPSSVPVCDEPPLTLGTGALTGGCSSGNGVNRQAWTAFAGTYEAVLALGPDATADQISEAACRSDGSYSPTYSVLLTAARYYGWEDQRWKNWDLVSC